jgi:hypothetical protein
MVYNDDIVYNQVKDDLNKFKEFIKEQWIYFKEKNGYDLVSQEYIPTFIVEFQMLGQKYSIQLEEFKETDFGGLE